MAMSIHNKWMMFWPYSYLIGSSYGYFHGLHITTYGEALLLAAQSGSFSF